MSEHDQASSHDPEQLPRDAPAEIPAPRLPKPPFWMISFVLISVVVTWLPLAVIWRARYARTSEPRIQVMQDMGVQPKFSQQQTNPFFADDREMRPHIPGTVARDDLEDDDHFYRGFQRTEGPDGKTAVDFAATLPPEIKLNMKLLQRGQQRFNIYCYVCHGYDGSGHGPVNEQAVLLQGNGIPGMTWTQAATLTSDTIRAQPDGKIFNTITNGIRNMPRYAEQIPPADRWAIVAYVRALQLSQCAPMGLVPKGATIRDAQDSGAAPASVK